MKTLRLGAVALRTERPESLAALIAFDANEASACLGFDLPDSALRAAHDLSDRAKSLKAITYKMALSERLQAAIESLGCSTPIRVQALSASVVAHVDLDMNLLLVHIARFEDSHHVARALSRALGPCAQQFLWSLDIGSITNLHRSAAEYNNFLGRWTQEARLSVYSASEQLALNLALKIPTISTDLPRGRI